MASNNLHAQVFSLSRISARTRVNLGFYRSGQFKWSGTNKEKTVCTKPSELLGCIKCFIQISTCRRSLKTQLQGTGSACLMLSFELCFLAFLTTTLISLNRRCKYFETFYKVTWKTVLYELLMLEDNQVRAECFYKNCCTNYIMSWSSIIWVFSL